MGTLREPWNRVISKVHDLMAERESLDGLPVLECGHLVTGRAFFEEDTSDIGCVVPSEIITKVVVIDERIPISRYDATGKRGRFGLGAAHSTIFVVREQVARGISCQAHLRLCRIACEAIVLEPASCDA